MKNRANKSSYARGAGPARRGAPAQNDAAAASPFALENEAVYRRWRGRKLAAFRKELGDAAKPVAVADPKMPGEKEIAAITERCRRRNFAFYRIDGGVDTPVLKRFWEQLGLRTLIANPSAGEDGVSRVSPTPGARYIPYTTRRLNWHTDGYYSAEEAEVRAFAMHCVHPAGEGGENQFFDPEILYILLRDENPSYVTALMHPRTLIVPRDAEETTSADDSQMVREARRAPVLALHRTSGDVVMRYTERQRYVAWRKDGVTAAARAFIREVLQTAGEYHVRRRLDEGEGVICNNVLHNRTGFSSKSRKAPQRLLYRARYRERVAGTGYAALIG